MGPLLRDARAVVPPAGLARDPHRLRLLHPVHPLHDGPREGRRMLGARDGARGRVIRNRVGVLDGRRVPTLRVQEAAANKGRLVTTGLFVFMHIPGLDEYLADRYPKEFPKYAATTAKFIPYIYRALAPGSASFPPR